MCPLKIELPVIKEPDCLRPEHLIGMALPTFIPQWLFTELNLCARLYIELYRQLGTETYLVLISMEFSVCCRRHPSKTCTNKRGWLSGIWCYEHMELGWEDVYQESLLWEALFNPLLPFAVSLSLTPFSWWGIGDSWEIRILDQITQLISGQIWAHTHISWYQVWCSLPTPCLFVCLFVFGHSARGVLVL